MVSGYLLLYLLYFTVQGRHLAPDRFFLPSVFLLYGNQALPNTVGPQDFVCDHLQYQLLYGVLLQQSAL